MEWSHLFVRPPTRLISETTQRILIKFNVMIQQ
jgi:hypothetical protein